MRCLPASCLALSLIAACQSAPARFHPLPLEERFPVSYEGRIAPLADADRKSVAEPAVALPVPGASVVFRSTIVELPLAEARALAPELLAPVPTSSGLQMQGGHVDAAFLRSTLRRLANSGCLRAEPFTIARIGTSSTISLCAQTAYVSAFKIAGTLWSKVMDPEVEVFQYGTTLTFTPQRDGDALTVSIDWLKSDPVRPITLARTDSVALQVPVFTRERLSASTRLGEHDALVVGVLQGREPDTVMMLCVETDVVSPQVAAAQLPELERPQR
ncbi:MAG TPA: hypothetical protein VF384_08600 [Planctomycetota bacterium]